MSYAPEQIKHETKNCFVIELKNGTYEVLENKATHATRVTFTSFAGEKGLKRAVSQCDFRQRQIDAKRKSK